MRARIRPVNMAQMLMTAADPQAIPGIASSNDGGWYVIVVSQAIKTDTIGTPAPIAATPRVRPRACMGLVGKRSSISFIRSRCSHSRRLCRCFMNRIVGTSANGIKIAVRGINIALIEAVSVAWSETGRTSGPIGRSGSF
jgi:hypothetical protein